MSVSPNFQDPRITLVQVLTEEYWEFEEVWMISGRKNNEQYQILIFFESFMPYSLHQYILNEGFLLES